MARRRRALRLYVNRTLPPGGVGRTSLNAFEPMLASAGSIVRTRALNRLQQLTVVPVALSDCGDLSIQSLPQVRGMVDSTLAGASFEKLFWWLRSIRFGRGSAGEASGSTA